MQHRIKWDDDKKAYLYIFAGYTTLELWQDIQAVTCAEETLKKIMLDEFAEAYDAWFKDMQALRGDQVKAYYAARSEG